MTPSIATQRAGDAGVDTRPATRSGTFLLAGELPVHRLGFGAMRLTGEGIWGEPRDAREAIAVLRRRARSQSDRYRRLLRSRGERAAHCRGALPLPAGARDRYQGGPRAAWARPVEAERTTGAPPRVVRRQPAPAQA